MYLYLWAHSKSKEKHDVWYILNIIWRVNKKHTTVIYIQLCPPETHTNSKRKEKNVVKETKAVPFGCSTSAPVQSSFQKAQEWTIAAIMKEQSQRHKWTE